MRRIILFFTAVIIIFISTNSIHQVEAFRPPLQECSPMDPCDPVNGGGGGGSTELPYLLNTGLKAKLFSYDVGYDIPNHPYDYLYEIWIYSNDVTMFNPLTDFSRIVIRNPLNLEYFSCSNECIFRDDTLFIEYGLTVDIQSIEDIVLTNGSDFLTNGAPEYDFYKYHLYPDTGYIHENSNIPSNIVGEDYDDYNIIKSDLHGFESTDGSKVLLTTNRNYEENDFGSYLIANSLLVCQSNISLCEETYGNDTFTSYFMVEFWVINEYRYHLITDKPINELHLINDDLPSSIIFVKKW